MHGKAFVFVKALSANLLNTLGDETVREVVHCAGVGRDRHQLPPFVAAVARLLKEFALCGIQRSFAFFHYAARQLVCLDAQRVADMTGIRSLQIHNGGLCHIDADMTARALLEYDTKGLDLLILENIGNLVCPAEFDTGAHKNVTILSVPEGDDKPLKYPLMYTVSDVVLINKMDTLEYFDFDLEKAKASILALNPKAVFLPISAKTGEGLDAVCEWILDEVSAVKAGS